MPQYCIANTQGLSPSKLPRLQIKNIKLHIVTDIKVNFNSMLGFRISTFGWGDGYFMHQRKYCGNSCTFHACLWSISILFWRPNVPQTCKRASRRWAYRTKNLYFSRIFLAKMKSLRHQVFPGGPPSKYYPGPTMLNFRDQTRTGVFIVVWS